MRFTDGQQWLVSDAGVALVGHSMSSADPGTRLVFERDSQGRIERAIGRQTASADATTDAGTDADAAIVYRYDGAGRLALARSQYGSGTLNQAIGYHADGSVITEAITAQLGTTAAWLGAVAAPTNSWSGSLAAGSPARFSFSTRDSELASTVKTPGAAGAIVYAVETQVGSTLAAEGAAVLGQASTNGKTVFLLRVTQAGLALLTLSGSGPATLKITVAGDLNRDGRIDGADSAGLAAANADLDGNGVVNDGDRQLLYANYGWLANVAPLSTASADPILTHTDLGKTLSLDTAALDREGDRLFWRVVGAAHGSAKLAGDGQSILFQPEADYVGDAAVNMQADDGYSASGNIVVNFKVSGARLLALHLQPVANLLTGQAAAIQATADFADEQGVRITSGSYLRLCAVDLTAQGSVGPAALELDDAHDRLLARKAGPALIQIERRDSDGRIVRAVAALNVGFAPLPITADTERQSEGAAPLVVEPDVYPGTLSLAPGGQRQLKVKITDLDRYEPTDVHAATGTRYVVSDESIATVSASGLVTAVKTGKVTVSVTHLASVHDADGNIVWQVIGQHDIVLSVQAAQAATAAGIAVEAAQGGIVAAATGETVLIGPGALKENAAVKIERIAIANIAQTLGLPLPATNTLQAVAAFRLDIGSQIANAALQLALPLQGAAAF